MYSLKRFCGSKALEDDVPGNWDDVANAIKGIEMSRVV